MTLDELYVHRTPRWGSLGASLMPPGVRGGFELIEAAAAYDPTTYVPPWQPPPPYPGEAGRPPPLTEPEEVTSPVAHDWGHFFRDVITPWVTPDPVIPYLPGSPPIDPGVTFPSVPAEAPPVTGGLGPEACEGMIWTGAAPPKGYKVVNWCGRGVLRKVRRRRRRRLLTASDKSDIAAIVGLVGKGQMASSLITRVGT